MKYIYHHLGLGDHIICNGLVRSLINVNYEYTMFVKPHNLNTVKFMYKDLKNLFFLESDDFGVNDFFIKNQIKDSDKIIAGFYRVPGSLQFDDSFYLQNNLPFKNRWENFYVERNMEKEKEIFNHFNVKENEYIFLHEDLSRGFKINRNHITNKNLKIIEPKKGLTENIFDYCYLMENSIESHFIDSSFRLIFDSLKLRNTNIFYHINLMDGIIKDPNTYSQSFLNFKII
jgi:hypothetical protein